MEDYICLKITKYLFLSMARSGYDAAKLLAKRGNKVVLNDKDDKQEKNLI